MILRSVPGLKRGLGTIRQDVNVSVKDGARTEIKGFQEVRSIPAVIDNEIKRQLDMIKKGKRAEESVRKAEADGTTSYLRPMPGAERMYPETDVPAITPEIKDIGKVELLSEKSGRMMKLGLAKDLANAVAKEGKADIMLDFAGKFPDVKPAFIAETMISTPRTLKRKENIDVRPTDRDFETIFSRINEGKISRDAVYDILKDIGKTGKPDFSKYGNLTGSEIEKINTSIDIFKKELRSKSDLNYKINFTSLTSIDKIINHIKAEMQKVADDYSGNFDSAKLDKLKKEKGRYRRSFRKA